MSQSNVPPPFTPLKKPEYDLHNNVENELMPLPRTLRPNPYADLPIAQLDIDDGANSFDPAPKSSPLAYRRLVEGDSGELRFGSSLPLLGADYDGANSDHVLKGLSALGIAGGVAADIAIGKFSRALDWATDAGEVALRREMAKKSTDLITPKPPGAIERAIGAGLQRADQAVARTVNWTKAGAPIPTKAADFLGMGTMLGAEIGAWIGFNELVYEPTNERNQLRKEDMIRQTLDRTPWYIRPDEIYGDPDYMRIITEEWGEDTSKWNFDPPSHMKNVFPQIDAQTQLEMAFDFDPNLHNARPGQEYWRADSGYLDQLEGQAAYLRREFYGHETPLSQNIDYHQNKYGAQNWDPDNPLGLYLPEMRNEDERKRQQQRAQQAARRSSDGYQSRYMNSTPLDNASPFKRPGG